MVVQQDQLVATDTGITFSGFYPTGLGYYTASGADRILHNGTDILRATFWGSSAGEVLQAPQFRYYQTNGAEKAAYTPQHSYLLDVCYERVSGKYFTIRYDASPTSGTLQEVDDQFDNAGSNFDSNKWLTSSELNDNNYLYLLYTTKDFNKVANKVSFTTTLDKKYLQSRYYLPTTWEATLDFNITTLTGNRTASFGILATDYENGHSVYEVGVTRSGSSDFFYNVARSNYQAYGLAYLSNFAFDVNRLPSGTVDWTLGKITTGQWSLTNTAGLSGTITPTPSGHRVVGSGGVDFTLENGLAVNTSDLILFTTKYRLDNRASNSGTLYISRTNNDYSSSNSVSFNETITVDSNNSRVSIAGQNIGSILNITGDNFNITTGTPTFPAYPRLKIERVNAEGQVQQNIINNFEVLSPLITYNNLISGSINIAVSPSQIMYARIYDRVYSFTCTGTIGGSGLVNSGTAGISTSISGLVPTSGISSFFYNELSPTSLSYTFYDGNVNELRVKTLTTDQPPVASNRQVFLNVSDYNSYLDDVSRQKKPYKFFPHGTDANSLFYIKRNNNNLAQFNIDPNVSAFSAVNSDDYSLQVGTNDTASVTVEVINAWGDSLNGKTVSFVLTSGDGVINPPSTVTSGSGVATTQYTAGALAGPVQIQVTVSD